MSNSTFACPACNTDCSPWFDRSICPEPCGSMHTRCSQTGRAVGGCPIDDRAERVRKYIDPSFLTDLAEIQHLLAEAYEHYMADPDNGGWKSMEGAITLHFPEFFWIDGFYGEQDMRQPNVSIYSYALGPNRNHTFGSMSEALDAVRHWHRDEMRREVER